MNSAIVPARWASQVGIRRVTGGTDAASRMPLISAGMAPVQPASPQPFTPNGFVVAGTGWKAISIGGMSAARGTAVAAALAEVMLMLSSSVTPIARVFELWILDEPPLEDESPRMILHSGSYGDAPDELAEVSREQAFVPGQDLVGQVWQAERPMLTADLARLETTRAAAVEQYDLNVALAIPVFAGPNVQGVFVMMY